MFNIGVHGVYYRMIDLSVYMSRFSSQSYRRACKMEELITYRLRNDRKARRGSQQGGPASVWARKVKKSSELFVFPIGTTGVQWKRWPAGGGNLEVAGGTDGERRTKVTSPGGGRRDVGEYNLVWPCSIGFCLRSCALLCGVWVNFLTVHRHHNSTLSIGCSTQNTCERNYISPHCI